jgi:hypothetical protein
MYSRSSSQWKLRSFVAAAFLAILGNLLGESDYDPGYAQVVDVDDPPINATEELDVKIFPSEPLPANGTVVVDTSEADDVEIESVPPEDVSIIITNSTVAVTTNPVQVLDETSQPDAIEGGQADLEGSDEG